MVLERIAAPWRRLWRRRGSSRATWRRWASARPAHRLRAGVHPLAPPTCPAGMTCPSASTWTSGWACPSTWRTTPPLPLYGEFVYGAGRGCRHIVYITVSTGIGGGLISTAGSTEGPRARRGDRPHHHRPRRPPLRLRQAGPRGGLGLRAGHRRSRGRLVAAGRLAAAGQAGRGGGRAHRRDGLPGRRGRRPRGLRASSSGRATIWA